MSFVEAKAQPLVAKDDCSTRMNITKYRHEWTIFNVRIVERRHGFDQLVSPTFSILGKCDEYNWQLKVNPRFYYSPIDDKKRYGDYLLMQLMKFESFNTARLTGKFKFSFRNIKEELVTVVELDDLFTFGKQKWSEVQKTTIKRDFLLDPANGLLINDSLTLVCDITIAEALKTGNDPVCSNKLPESQLPDTLSALFESLKFSDVTLIACGREFKAHKAILALRSLVFSAMFEHEVKGQRQNRVNIPDMDDEVLNEMLRFIYTEKVTNLNKMADGLLMAAGRYQLEGLKALCIKELEESLSIDNAAPRLIIADLYNVAHLKQQILNFFSHIRRRC